MRQLRSVLVLATLLVPVAADAPGSFFSAAVSDLEIGAPMVTEHLILFPLLAPAAPSPVAVGAGLRAPGVRFEEALWPDQRYDVNITTGDKETMLVLGGSVLTGGKLDRMLPRNLLLLPGLKVEVRALPAEYQQSYRARPKPFSAEMALAPPYLRKQALRDADRNLVPRFVSHFLRLRDKGDRRLSLAAVGGARALEPYCLACQRKAEEFPELSSPRVVGFISVVRGRVQTLELFATNALLRAHLEPLVRGHVYAAAALALRAEQEGVPLVAAGEKAVDVARAQARSLLDRTRTAEERSVPIQAGTTGTALRLRTVGAEGEALGQGGRLIHAVLFADDPFEDDLFAEPLYPPAAPPKADPPDDGQEDGELDPEALKRRQERGGRLTEYERRVLERLRGRRDGDG